MKTLTVYDPAMCCSTGVCGPQVDPVLVRFATDLKWLATQQVKVERHNLSQNPAAFIENPAVKSALEAGGDSALPVIVADGKVIASGRYPDRDELCKAVGIVNVSMPRLKLTPRSGECCGGGKC